MNALHPQKFSSSAVAQSIRGKRADLEDLFNLISIYCEQFHTLFCSIQDDEHLQRTAKGLAGIGKYLSEDFDGQMECIKEQMLGQAVGGNDHE